MITMSDMFYPTGNFKISVGISWGCCTIKSPLVIFPMLCRLSTVAWLSPLRLQIYGIGWQGVFSSEVSKIFCVLMSIIVQQDATIYSLLYFCKLLYMFRVVTLYWAEVIPVMEPPLASICNEPIVMTWLPLLSPICTDRAYVMGGQV
jgi:hypothetical protein